MYDKKINIFYPHINILVIMLQYFQVLMKLTFSLFTCTANIVYYLRNPLNVSNQHKVQSVQLYSGNLFASFWYFIEYK